MARKQDQREMVLERLAAHLLATGLARTSLRELAVAAGVSDRMLIYYFNDKAEILAEAVALVAGQLAVSLGTAIPEGTVLPPSQLADRAAEITTRPALRPYMRLWIEIAAAAARREEPYPGIAAQIMAGFRAWIEPRLDVANEKERASAALAVIAICDGLALIDICAGDDAIEAARSALPLGPRQQR
jgi:AcrR family transcriptional regulator